ncbi:MULTISPECIES: carboxylesterase/lipase family protein [Pseudonocardia]|uniref:Carboxylic ester hydrolase n=2 Tax=Pseudonocardia TaxID=1847 RepID=A0A1Y2N5X4_PSEAH|nr:MULTISPECIES: carboxylesterase family protein [Pseudonocardia]OSY42318.1 Carboxylesterase [Pseudonocardia autotrophica]TDN75838.1 carboxylesterase type B [Pseudonocardia autotrophica]BBF99809.1 carboxylic ester hydrolase [Pseudonocardia autotrophica]GEC27605.1 carboxylic ester hydrolase [Pseudonocardia saturnea]
MLQQDEAAPVVELPQGAVRGARHRDGVVYRALPYAAPPVGALRFRPPEPPSSWSGVREATRTGPTAPQAVPQGEIGRLLGNPVDPGDDHLHLDVWAPEQASAAPVVVFVHGGAFVTGSNAVGGYTGGSFARDGIVYVGINYRLGADGFLWLGEGTPNLGLLDQVAALRWVRDHIALFGGDPGNVTVMGESAGAMSIGALLAMPAARGLFGRAILQSGAGHHTLTPESAHRVGTRLAALLGVPATREAIAGIEPARVVAAQMRLAAELVRRPFRRGWAEIVANLMPFEPVVDGEVLPRSPIDAARAGSTAPVDLLIGHNLEEARLFLSGFAENGLRTRLAARLMARRYRLGAGLRGYPRTGSDLDLLCDVLTDAVYRIPALRLAETHGRSHLYRFGWRSPAWDGRLGAAHAVELPFVFDSLDHPDWHGLLGDERPRELAREMHAAWVSFIRSGDPGWPAYETEHRREREFAGAGRVVTDADRARRIAWDGRR